MEKSTKATRARRFFIPPAANPASPLTLRQRLLALLESFNSNAVGRSLLLTAGGILLIIAFCTFMAPANIAPGGVSGLALIISSFTGWSQGLMMLLLNLPALALGYVKLGRFRFLRRTIYVILLFNLGVAWLLPIFPQRGITDDFLLDALFGGVVAGIGYGLVVLGGGTMAGTGIISRLVQKRTSIPIGQIYVFIDGVVIIALGLTFSWEIGLYSIIMLFVRGIVTDYVLEGPSVVRTVFIVTDSPEEIAQCLMNKLHLGVTAWPVEGMFTHEPHVTLFCTVGRSDVHTLKRRVAEIDPMAFIVIGQGHHASGGVLRALRSYVTLPPEEESQTQML